MKARTMSIMAGLIDSSTKSFESGRNLAIVGFGLFIYVSVFIYFPRKRPFPRGPGPQRGYAIAVLWGRWVLLAVGLYGVLKMIAS
jgi:hypothetical protein